MGRDYEGAADHAKDSGVLRPSDVERADVSAKLGRFFSQEDPNSEGARKLVDETTREAMDQMVRAADGSFYAKRGSIKVYEDRWGNIMGQEGSDLSSRSKLVDKSER